MRLAATLPDGVVLGPLAARDHIDHRIAREACCKIANTRPVGFFEDLPYSVEISAESLYEYVAQVQEITGCHLVPHLVGGTPSDEDKGSLVEVYGSQLEPSDYAAVARAKGSGERLWLPEEHLDCFRFLVMMDAQ